MIIEMTVEWSTLVIEISLLFLPKIFSITRLWTWVTKNPEKTLKTLDSFKIKF